MVRKRIVGLAMALAVAFGVAAAGTYAVFAHEQEERQPPVSCEAPQPFDFGKLYGD